MGNTCFRRCLPVVIVGVLASVGMAACGDDDEGDDVEAYCAFVAELDAVGRLPTDEVLDELTELAPDEIADDVAAANAILKEEGEAAGQNPDIEELFAPIEEFEAENCDIAEGDGGGADTTSVDSGGSDIEAYCADVTAFARSARIIDQEAASGFTYEPQDLANLTARGEELATTASDLSANTDLSTEDAEALTECSQQASEALASVADILAEG